MHKFIISFLACFTLLLSVLGSIDTTYETKVKEEGGSLSSGDAGKAIKLDFSQIDDFVNIKFYNAENKEIDYLPLELDYNSMTGKGQVFVGWSYAADENYTIKFSASQLQYQDAESGTTEILDLTSSFAGKSINEGNGELEIGNITVAGSGIFTKGEGKTSSPIELVTESVDGKLGVTYSGTLTVTCIAAGG